jgi:linoleoyl-CoA desaturase
MYLKTAIILASFASAYGLLVFVATTWWQALPLAIVLALTVVAIGFNIMHDASHQAYSDRRWVNRLMAMSLDRRRQLVFLALKHVVFHHTFVNVIGYDTDIDLAGLGRLTPHHRERGFIAGSISTSGSCTVSWSSSGISTTTFDSR